MDNITMAPDTITRLENKIDKLTDAVNRLVLVEERQIRQGERIGTMEQRLASAEANFIATDKRVDKWINRGMGAWAFAGALWVLYSKISPFLNSVGH